MQVSTGRIYALEDPAVRTIPPEDLVLIEGDSKTVERLGETVRLGNAERERRRKKNKQQRQARKRGRA